LLNGWLLLKISFKKKVNENWRKRYNKLLGVLDILSFVRISPLNLIGHVNRMDFKRRASKVINNNPQGSRLRGRPKPRRGKCVQTNINRCKIKIWKERSKNRAEWQKFIKVVKVCIGL
jgi:hypothetical protein